MPPFVPRKRHQSSSPAESPPPKRRNVVNASVKRGKQALFDAADTPLKKGRSAEETKRYLETLDDNEDDDASSLSDLGSDDFEDVPSANHHPHHSRRSGPTDEEQDEDEMDWEDAIDHPTPSHKKPGVSGQPEPEIGDISVSLKEDGTYTDALTSMAAAKKGPSKRERQIRFQTHCLHVQTLMWHNTVRNSWLNDKKVQENLTKSLPVGVKWEIKRWKEAMGMLSKEEQAEKKLAAAKAKNKRGGKGQSTSNGRDWNFDAEHMEQGVPNLSQGDPLLKLLKILTAYWRKVFTPTAPGLRKQGYMPLRRLRDEIKGWEKNRSDAAEHGERIENLAAFRELAKQREGSRDVGAQLFVALLRGIGVDTRMVANLQPAGLGWSKAEDAEPKRAKKARKPHSVDSDLEIVEEVSPRKSEPGKKATTPMKKENPIRKSEKGTKAEPVNLDDSDSPLSELSSIVNEDDADDDSVVDITPLPQSKKTTTKFDRDLAFPNYWIEACSPVSHKYIPVDPIVLSTIASNDELQQTFEPRGKKAEVSKQVICYTVAFSADGSAKDVTVRYLKRHQLPGKTKGMRMATEKIPIYNHRGKVKKYEDYDWFRTVMLMYDRPQAKRTRADDLEDQTDLKPYKPQKEEKEVEKESLQWYKQSAEFVLEQHLRREEAVVPGAEPVKTFTAGKGDKAKEHPVYRREDVVTCKTVESWHKEGRAIKEREQPIKHVPMRAVTLIKKREMEDVLRETGEKMQQGLYSRSQTDWIIPPPIENGVIPKNVYNNIDVYVPTMVPQGAVHLPLKGTAKLCKRLQIDFAEACTGFEFGKQRAVPVLTGVVVAEEHAALVRDAWRAEQREIKRKEDTKRTDAALKWWRKMLMGMRIVERMKAEYDQAGGSEHGYNPFVSRAEREGRAMFAVNRDDDDEQYAGAGGFFAPGHDEEEVPQHYRATSRTRHEDADDDKTGGFLVEDGASDGVASEGFLAEENAKDDADQPIPPPKNHAPITPVSLQSLHKGQLDSSEAASEDEPTLPHPAQRRSSEASKAKAKATSAQPPRLSAKRAPSVNSEHDADASPSDASSDVESNDSTISQTKPRPSSPRVLLTPRKGGTKAALKLARGGRTVKKATPLRSQYFSAPIDGTDEEDDDDSSEAEVVKPRQTTARTRRRG